jgi:hypothetical protein
MPSLYGKVWQALEATAGLTKLTDQGLLVFLHAHSSSRYNSHRITKLWKNYYITTETKGFDIYEMTEIKA